MQAVHSRNVNAHTCSGGECEASLMTGCLRRARRRGLTKKKDGVSFGASNTNLSLVLKGGGEGEDVESLGCNSPVVVVWAVLQLLTDSLEKHCDTVLQTCGGNTVSHWRWSPDQFPSKEDRQYDRTKEGIILEHF